MKRAACYIRVSTDDQMEYSPDSQLREIQSYAARNSLHLLEDYIFIDEGISGRNAEKRPAFQRMISIAKQLPKPFDVVLLYKYSRFARNREDSVVFKSMLRGKCGIDVVSITEPLDTENKMSGVIEAVIESMDEYYSANLSEDVTRTMTEKAMRGELQASPSYGYGVKENVLVPIEKEAAVVREIFQRFVDGDGYYTIAADLNARGLRTHRGNPFENRTIKYLLQNPVYIGKLRWTPAAKARRSSNPLDSQEPIIRDARHQPLIDLELWEQAQQKVRDIDAKWTKYQKPGRLHVSWVSGLVRCAHCGRALCHGNGWWRCNGYAKGLCKTSQLMADEKLKELLLSQIEKDFMSAEDLTVTLVRRDNIPGEYELCQEQLDKIPSKLQRAKEAYLAGADTVEEYKTTKLAIQNDEVRLQNRLKELSGEAIRNRNRSKRKKSLIKAGHFLRDPLTAEEDKKAAVGAVIQKCTIDKESGLLLVEYFIAL